MGNSKGLWKIAIAAILISAIAGDRFVRASDLVLRQATIKGMVVRHLENQKMTGMAMGIIATAGAKAKDGKVTIRGKIGDDMKSALDEAVRYVRVNHPDLGNADISISFEERYSPKDGGSAGTAFAILLRSLTEGISIDDKVAITGDIAVNGKVMPIGGVTAKLRGAMNDGCTIIVVPTENVPAVGDLIVRPADQLEILKGLQVFSVNQVDDAVAIVRTDRADKLAQSIKLYAELQDDMKKKGMTAIKSKAGQEKLATILDLTPNHVMAKYALDIAKGQGPKTLTRNGSLGEIFAAAWPCWQVLISKDKKVSRETLPVDLMKSVKADLGKLQRFTHPDVDGLRKAMLTWVDTIDTILNARRDQFTESDVHVIDQRREALLKELKRLSTDETLVAKMMREGY